MVVVDYQVQDESGQTVKAASFNRKARCCTLIVYNTSKRQEPGLNRMQLH